MGKILEFVPRCSRHSKSMGEGPQCFSKCREEVEAALTSKPVTVEPTSKVERRAVKVRKAPASGVINPAEPGVINSTAARKRGRPIKSNDTAHQQGRERSRLYRERKAATQVGKERV